MAEPVRPMDQQTVSKTTKRVGLFSFKTADGKKESVPVLLPKQIDYPSAGLIDTSMAG